MYIHELNHATEFKTIKILYSASEMFFFLSLLWIGANLFLFTGYRAKKKALLEL